MRKLLIILFVTLVTFTVSGQTTVTVSGIDTTLTTYLGYSISTASEKFVIIENSKFNQTINDRYLLDIGDDDYDSETALNLNGAIVTGNYCDYTHTSLGAIHSVLAGYSLNYKIKFNYFDAAFYGIVAEGGYDSGESMVNTNYVIQGNIFRNNSSPFNTTGYDGIKFYNNTVYHNKGGSTWINRVAHSNGTTIPAPAKNIKIKNNIFYTVDNDRILSVDTSCTTGFECDYNIYWVENDVDNEPRFQFNGITYSWDQWQALGFDTHSVIRDPEFIDTIDFIPTSVINIGDDLGSLYSYAMDTSIQYVVGTHPDTIQQGDNWQVGAVIYEKPNLGGYYVADTSFDVNASDSNDGTFSSPWATWQKGINEAEAGDTVYFRSGIWYPNDSVTVIVEHDPQDGYGDSGVYNNPIVFMNYPGEEPILDCSKNYPPGGIHAGLQIQHTDYVEYHGLTIRNLYSVVKASEVDCLDLNVTNNGTVVLNEMVAHNGGGRGFWISANDTIYLTNCDSYNRCDSLDAGDPGGDADGFNIATGDKASTAYVYMTGCRAWNCSDDGVDLGAYSHYYLYNNWFFFNGSLYASPYDGDGTGIKTSGSVRKDVTKRQMHNNVTAFNDGGGIGELNLYSPAGVFMQAYNNTSYKDSEGYRSSLSGGDWDYETDSGSVVSVNNLIYAPSKEAAAYSENLTSLGAHDPPYDYTTTTTDSWDWVDPQSHWYNRYNPAFTITDADFTNLDSATIFSQLSASRKSDGSLPDITVLKLTEGSDLIDGGTDVGLTYSGLAPDLGAFESNYGGRTRKPALGSGGVVAVSSDGKILYFNNE